MQLPKYGAPNGPPRRAASVQRRTTCASGGGAGSVHVSRTSPADFVTLTSRTSSGSYWALADAAVARNRITRIPRASLRRRRNLELQMRVGHASALIIHDVSLDDLEIRDDGR